MKELLVSLDLELNQPSRRIIQIGAVVGNIRTGEIVSRFDSKVSPRRGTESRDRQADRNQTRGGRRGTKAERSLRVAETLA